MTQPPVETGQNSLEMGLGKAAQKMHNELVSWTHGQYREIRNARDHQERQWYMNLAFYNGKQYVAPLRPGNTGTRLHVPPAPYYVARPVHNRIRSIIRTELAQLTNNKPTATVIPASAEDRDMYAAMAGEQIWESEYREKKVKAIIKRAVWWMCVTGTGYIKTVWDSRKGPLSNETGQRLGDIDYSAITPFHIMVPNLREEEIENQPFVIHSTTHSPEIIASRFGPEAVKNASPNNANELIEESFLNIMGDGGLQKQHSVLMHEVWIKPGYLPMFPEGAFFTVIGSSIVQGQQGWPFNHGMYPFAKIDGIPSGKYYATSVIEDLIPIQKEYNRTHAQIIESKNRTAKPKLMGPKNSVDPTKITSEPGQFIPYNPGLGKPEYLPPPPLPGYVMQELEILVADMNDIAGQHEVSQGSVPPGVTAATAISYLQERDESKLTAQFDSVEDAVEKTAKLTLNYVKDYWNHERVIKTTGTDGSFDAMVFTGADLAGNTDIRIEAGSSLPNSKAAKQAFVMDLIKLGAVKPDRGLEVMDMGGLNKIYEQVQVDRRQASRENLRMSKVTPELILQHQELEMQKQQALSSMTGQPPQIAPIVPVNTWDNHQAHIEVHNNYRKSQTFEQLPDEVKKVFEEHVQMHVAAMGAELILNNPQIAAGLPPGLALPGMEQAEEENKEKESPGPEPRPEIELEM